MVYYLGFICNGLGLITKSQEGESQLVERFWHSVFEFSVPPKQFNLIISDKQVKLKNKHYLIVLFVSCNIKMKTLKIRIKYSIRCLLFNLFLLAKKIYLKKLLFFSFS